MPTRLYHKGKTRGSEGISFHKLEQELRTPPPEWHTKNPKGPASMATRLQENALTPFSDVLAFLHHVDDVGSENWVAYSFLTGRQMLLTSMGGSSLHQLCFVAIV